MIPDTQVQSVTCRDGQLIAADCVNRAQEFMLIKKIITEKIRIDSHQLADASISLNTLLHL